MLPRPAAPFNGKIGFLARDSVPDWPAPPHAPAGAPNIVVILVDDVGFSATSTFGGPVETPTFDRLATQGLRYNRFNVTSLCAPTRAALLSGRNDHRVGFGSISTFATGFPGYNGIWRKDTATIAEVLRLNGYSTAAFGKWHNTPPWEITPAGPFDRWPTGLGFEYFYGFLAGRESEWEPTLYRDTELVDPPATPEQGYYLNVDLADDAIRWLHTHRSIAPEKPYFLYFAPGATHVPQQVPKEWIRKYHGRFGEGWDRLREETFARQKRLGVIPADAELTARAPELPPWDSLSADERELCSRQMEVYAGYLAETDHELGRVIDVVQRAPGGDNTLIICIVGDNGADAQSGPLGADNSRSLEIRPGPTAERLRHLEELGGPKYVNGYASGWAWALCTPFQWEKTIASHFGGTRDPMVVVWPSRIKDRGGLRSQYTHANDVAPTLCEAVGIPFPTVVNGANQISLDGTSFLYTFDDPKAPSRHRLQVFEQVDNRAVYQDGWVASDRHTIPWLPIGDDFSQDRWELYHVATDFSEAHDLAGREPEKLKALQALFEQEARRNRIYPLTGSVYNRGVLRPLDSRREFTFFRDMPPIPTASAPNFMRSHRITADLIVPPGGAEGVLVSAGSRMGGFVLYVKANVLVYENNYSAANILTASRPLPPGRVQVEYQFDQAANRPRGTGDARLFIDGSLAAQARFQEAGAPLFGTFDIGAAHTSPVSSAYQLPFRFTGTLDQVRLEFMP